MIQMPNHTSTRYQFENGRELWALDKECMKIKSEICFCKSDKDALDKAEKKEIQWLCEIFHDEKLQHVTKTTKDHQDKSKAEGHLVGAKADGAKTSNITRCSWMWSREK